MMVFKKSKELSAHIEELKRKGAEIGFVPTMGALHEGHLALIRESIANNDFTVCSIFVNPVQFNNTEDFENYPSTLEKDLNLLEQEACNAVFLPDVDEIYPSGTENLQAPFDLGIIDEVLEGKYRPGHFKGVAVVVKRLFDIVQPDRAYFGEKDFQQLVLIKQMVKQLDIPVEVVGIPTVRTSEGLALSSRNLRLNPEQKKLALNIYKALSFALIKINESADLKEVKKYVLKQFFNHPNIRLEYFEIIDEHTLLPVEKIKKGQKIRIVAAAYVDNIRLIDNIGIIA
ncbi:MAG: pantoate--beta-alanine ligase [Bacteroidetes bacterium]|nr:MAG: pantoate--beta-alanine ligase [Bacteroidota bacterium]